MRPVEHRLDHYALGIFDGPHATPPESADGPVFLGIDNLTEDGRLALSNARFISEQDFPRWTRRVEPQAGDVVFSYEATLHRYAVIPEGFRGCLGRRLALVRPDPKKLDSKFLLYYFLTPHWRAVAGEATISGATVDRLLLTRVPSLPVSFPELDHQRRIASILSAYDDLIENNNRRIALLEQAARLLYEEWFVRLRFPGREHTRIVDGVPKGWRRKTLGDLCVEVREQVSPENVEPDTPYIGLEHMPRRSITLGTWGTAADVTSTKHRYRTGEVLFGKIRPYFHKVGIALNDGVTSSDAIVIRPNDDALGPLVLMTTSSDHFVKYTSQTVREGSKMPRADWKVMQQYEVKMPLGGLLDLFADIIGPLTDQLKALTYQNRSARAARDLLLPRLMSGGLMV